MRKLLAFTLIVLVLLLVSPTPQSLVATPDNPRTSITISGVVAGPGGPVGDVSLGIGSPTDWQETITNSSGAYSVTINSDGQIWWHVRPPQSSGLAQINQWRDDISGDFTQDFTLVTGHRLDLDVTAAGAIYTQPLPLDIVPLEENLPDGKWYTLDWDNAAHHYAATLPSDVYHLTIRDAPAGYYQTAHSYDLRTADQSVTLPLNDAYIHPIPTTPPDATKISFGAANDLGEVAVSGAPGAALPLSRVLLVNLHSAHQSHTIAEADGRFSASIYAPPGTAVMVKHGPASDRWRDLEQGVSEGINPFPGTILHVPYDTAVGDSLTPFAGGGAVAATLDDLGTTRNYVSAAWSAGGMMGPVSVDGAWSRVFSGVSDGEAVAGLYRGGENWTHPALADLDGDGDQDLLVGEAEGHLVHYENQGTAAAPDWVWQTAVFAQISTGGWAYPALADLTGDNAPDLVVGGGDGQVQIYHNSGTPSAPAFPARPTTTLSAAHNAAPALTDLDNDGDLDLLVGGAEGTLSHYTNNGSATAPAWTLQSDDYGGIAESEGVQPAFLDLDGDDDLDLLLGLCGSLIWYERGGTAVSPTWTRHGSDPIGYGGGSCATSPAVADWNGDAAPDLVTGEHWGTLRFFANGPTWSEDTFSFPFELSGDSAPALGDWDDDGDLDLLVGQVHGQVQQYTNAGSAAAPDWQPDGTPLTLPWTDHPHPFPALADLDGDDDLDLVVGWGDWSGEEGGGALRYYENQGTTASPNWQLSDANWLGLDVGGWSAPVFADIDADADLDLFIGDAAGTLTFVENSGTAASPVWATPVQPYANLEFDPYASPAFHDADADGDLDLLVGGENGSLGYARNTGTAGAPAWEPVGKRTPGLDVGQNSRPAAGDLNDDGHADLLLGEGDGGLNLYHYDGPGTPPPPGDYQPGDLLHVSGVFTLTAPAIDAATDRNAISVDGWPVLMMIADEDGQALPAERYFMSTLLTPTGFPIQQPGRAAYGLDGHLALSDWQLSGPHQLSAPFTLTLSLPLDALPGTYRPTFFLDFGGVPGDDTWLAANVTYFTSGARELVLPPLTVGQPQPPRLPWRILMENFVQGLRGTGPAAETDFALASQIVTQDGPYITPPRDGRSGQATIFHLEPFLPTVSFTDRRMPAPPLIPIDLPGGELCLTITAPSGAVDDRGCAPFQQSLNRSSTTRAGGDLNNGTVQLEDVYSLLTGEGQFTTTFGEYGRYTVTLSGYVDDVWGNRYTGGGDYHVWVAEPLDIDPGVLPGTPLAAGDAFNPTLRLQPRVPAHVTLTLTHYPHSDPAQKETYSVSGAANPYGLFASNLQSPISLTTPGEFRVDVTAVYTASDGTLYMGSQSWGSVVMTPDADADLVAHGRRGVDSLENIPSNWFVNCRDLPLQAGAVSHTLNPYFNGDVLWTRMIDAPGECPTGVSSGGDSLILGASAQDTVGVIETAVAARAQRMNPYTTQPGDLSERFNRGEIPLFISTYGGLPPQMTPDDVDQWAYSYRSSQRPGVRVRELVAEDGQSGGYWRLDTLYDNQLGVGVLGDQPNDFKFQYAGVVYRDLAAGYNEYRGHGSGWVFIPDDDASGSRAMPPFAGPGNGGWTTEGGPLMTLNGEDVHIFIFPSGVKPGAIMEVGDTFRFAGHLMPTLDSQVAVTVTAPGGQTHTIGGQANDIGYFYNPSDDFVVDKPGLWTVDVAVWHNGQCSGGSTVSPYPSGDVLGSGNGRYHVYVLPTDASLLPITTPRPGYLSFDDAVTPVTVSGIVPGGVSNAAVEVTVTMPGVILQQESVSVVNGRFTFSYDPATLHDTFPNLDLAGRDDAAPGLADTVSINIYLTGQKDGAPFHAANTVTLQGEQVFVGGAAGESATALYLPLVSRP